MTISPAQLENFKGLYKALYGADLSNQEALEKGLRLIRLVEVVAKNTYENEKTPRNTPRA